jgi:hypothetical protein
MLIDIASVELADGDDENNLSSRISNRLISVPKVAAARANVIIPNRPIIPNTAYIR